MVAKKKAARQSGDTEVQREADEASEEEMAKLRGDTDAQKEIRAYHEGEFQTHDPVTGEPRSKPLPE